MRRAVPDVLMRSAAGTVYTSYPSAGVIVHVKPREVAAGDIETQRMTHLHGDLLRSMLVHSREGTLQGIMEGTDRC